MKKFTHTTWAITKRSIITFFGGDGFSQASAIAFCTIFSLPAILIISLSIASTVYEKDIVQSELINQVSLLIGPQSAMEIENILLNAAMDSTGLFARIVGIVTLAFSATTVFVTLQGSLNYIWGIKPKPERGLLKFIVNRLLSLAMVISIGFLLLVSLIIDTIVVVFQGMLSQQLDGLMVVVVTVVNFVFGAFLIMLIFALMFKVLPDAKIKWKDVWVGSFVTTILFTAGKYLIGLYLGNSSVNSAYGAAGSFVIILLWVYYSTVIFLFGAEVTFIYTKETGQTIKPYTNAVKVKTVEVEKSA